LSETPNHASFAPPMRRDEEIALEMMKFIAAAAGYGRATTAGAGFQGGASSRPEDYAKQFIDLYGQCLDAIRSKR